MGVRDFSEKEIGAYQLSRHEYPRWRCLVSSRFEVDRRGGGAPELISADGKSGSRRGKPGEGRKERFWVPSPNQMVRAHSDHGLGPIVIPCCIRSPCRIEIFPVKSWLKRQSLRRSRSQRASSWIQNIQISSGLSAGFVTSTSATGPVDADIHIYSFICWTAQLLLDGYPNIRAFTSSWADLEPQLSISSLLTNVRLDTKSLSIMAN